MNKIMNRLSRVFVLALLGLGAVSALAETAGPKPQRVQSSTQLLQILRQHQPRYYSGYRPGLTLMADTLAHVSLAGVAIGVWIGTPPVATATVTTLLAALGIESLRGRKGLLGDRVLAIFLSGSLALSIVILSAVHGLNGSLLAYLFGSITTVANTDLWLILGVALLAFGLFAYYRRQLFYVSFADDAAAAQGISVKNFNRLLVILAALTVAVSMQIVGILLIGALMVIPVLTAMQFGLTFRRTLQLAVIISVISVLSGLTISFYYNLASGGTIVILALVLFGISLLLHRRPILPKTAEQINTLRHFATGSRYVRLYVGAESFLSH